MPHVDRTCTTHHACDCISAELDRLRAENKRLREIVASCQPSTLEMLEALARLGWCAQAVRRREEVRVWLPEGETERLEYAVFAPGPDGYRGIHTRAEALALLKGGGDALHS